MDFAIVCAIVQEIGQRLDRVHMFHCNAIEDNKYGLNEFINDNRSTTAIVFNDFYYIFFYGYLLHKLAFITAMVRPDSACDTTIKLNGRPLSERLKCFQNELDVRKAWLSCVSQLPSHPTLRTALFAK